MYFKLILFTFWLLIFLFKKKLVCRHDGSEYGNQPNLHNQKIYICAFARFSFRQNQYIYLKFSLFSLDFGYPFYYIHANDPLVIHHTLTSYYFIVAQIYVLSHLFAFQLYALWLSPSTHPRIFPLPEFTLLLLPNCSFSILRTQNEPISRSSEVSLLKCLKWNSFLRFVENSKAIFKIKNPFPYREKEAPKENWDIFFSCLYK